MPTPAAALDPDPDPTLDALLRVASRRERAASRRLARAWGLTDAVALRRTLEASAGAGGLAALVVARHTAQAVALAAAQAAAARRRAARDAARAAASRRHDPAPDETAWTAWFDGSARPNPGRCAIGALLRGPGGITLDLARPAGHGDSSDAESRALIAVLDAALAHGAQAPAIFGDSRVVIDDVNGPDAGAAPALAGYRAHVRALLARLPGATLSWVPRHRNRQADALSQQAFAAVEATCAAPAERGG